MAKKKPEAHIPLRFLFKDESFKRNWKLFQGERETRNEALFEAITDELLSNASANVIRYEQEKEHHSKGGRATRWTVAWKNELADLMLENTSSTSKSRFRDAMAWLSRKSEGQEYGYELPTLGGEVYVDGNRICYYNDGDNNTSPKRDSIKIDSFQTGPFYKRNRGPKN